MSRVTDFFKAVSSRVVDRGAELVGKYVRFDAAEQRLWLSQATVSAAMRRHNAGVGAVGLALEATVADDTRLRVDITPKPFGPAGVLAVESARVTISATEYELVCQVGETDTPAALLLKVVPIVFGVMLGLGLEAPKVRSEGKSVTYGGALPTESWLLTLIRGCGGLRSEVTLPITFGGGGVYLGLSGLLAPGAVIDPLVMVRALPGVLAWFGAGEQRG